MAEQKKEGSLFSFGGTSSSGNTQNLFGSSPSNPFGSTTAKPSGNIFGSGTSAPSSSGSLFGSSQPTASSTQSSTLFAQSSAPAPTFGGFALSANTGTAATPAGGLFSTPNKPAETSSGQAAKNTTGSSVFDGSASTATINAPQGSTTPAQNKPTGLFGNLSTTPAGPPPSSSTGSSSLFGGLNKGQDAKPLFGALSTQTTTTSAASKPASSLFGGAAGFSSTVPPPSSQANQSISPTQTSTQTRTTDGTNAQTGSSLASFGSQNPTPQSKSFFGNLGSTDTTGGTPSTTTASSKATPSLSFSQSSAAPSFGTSSVFNVNSNTPATTANKAPTSNLFNTTGATTTTSGGGPSLFAPQSNSQQSSSATATSAAPASALFSGLGAKDASTQPASTPSAAGNLFGVQGVPAKPTGTLGQASTLAPAPAATAASSTSQPPATSATNAPLQTASATNAAQAGAQSSTNLKTDDTSKATGLGASTGGPKPTPQSRLKNKSMDEIITRWASDLNKYQKEFQSQAKTVAKWDRMLVENSDKIQKLYGHTLEAERATIEVERQLTAVENDQAELEYWLEHYEHQVEELMSKQMGQSDSLSGPDQERERTYKLAEKLSDRLDEMGKDLTAMVDEINDASSNLSKTTKPDDPLSQIVRVLNGHLSQLQQIDQSTAALQAKVQAAQKAGRQVGVAGGRSGIGGDAADDFYRSYMGRR